MMQTVTDHKFRTITRWTAAVIFLLSALLYALTAEPTVSYWDCPEYVTTAARLEPGHPPGNPVWTLTARIFTLLVPAPQYAALAVNIMSGICSAVAVMLLFLTLCILIRKLIVPSGQEGYLARRQTFITLAGSLCGAAALAVSDTFWFSATEAEVYAMSVMLTALTFWLAFRWGEAVGRPNSSRYLVLIAYITGLAIGVHQLNLLVLPALALIVVFYVRDSLRPGVLAAVMLASLVIIAAVLFAMMPGVLDLAGKFEIFAVNTLALPLHSGTLIYVFLTLAALIAAALLTGSDRHKSLSLVISAFAIWLCGLLSFGGAPLVGAILCLAILIPSLIFRRRFSMIPLNITMWCAAMLFTGYCSYALIIIRGAANPPLNTGAPSDIFALTSYLHRDQYGGAPLLYGPTPYSQPLYEETVTRDENGKPQYRYTSFHRDTTAVRYSPVPGPDGRPVYRVSSCIEKLAYPPELNMWFPRIYSGNPDDIESYAGWTGMTADNMTRVRASAAIDSAGNYIGRFDPDSARHVKKKVLRPTYLQNLSMFAGYQMSYMYFRYLLWNFAGRQNDVYGQGEADAGNFITGFDALDALMLEHPEKMPPDIGRDNPGHHEYYLLPLLLGIIGLAYQCARSRRQFAIVLLFFILTGVAIVVYLNQTPGQPRERDYSFVGSFYAWCIWIGMGACFLAEEAASLWSATRRRMLRRPVAVVLMLAVVAVPVVMAVENFPDHDRSGRYATRDYALNMLEPLPKNAVIFVNGDNFTFPLWYLQEVEGKRPDVRTVNLAYTATPWYVLQLAVPGPGSPALKLGIPAEKMNLPALTRYLVVNIGHGTADARTAIGRLFSTTPLPDKRPTIAADSLRLPMPGGNDSVTVSLRDVSGGKSYIRLDRLIMLSIIAHNTDRPIYWQSSIGDHNFLTLKSQTTPEALNRRLSGRAAALGTDSLMRTARIILKHFRGGNLNEARFADMPARWQALSMREMTLSTAVSLLKTSLPGDSVRIDAARRLLLFADKAFPADKVPLTAHKSADTECTTDAALFSEAWGLFYSRTGRPEYLNLSRRYAATDARIRRQYSDYINALSPRYRQYTKTSTRLLAAPAE